MREVTLFSGQWTDLPLEEACKAAREMGYDGMELATWGLHLDLAKGAEDQDYAAEVKGTLAGAGLKCHALGAHLVGQCTGDLEDPRLNGFAPGALSGKPDEIREWAVRVMKLAPKCAANLEAKVVTGFMGSPVWRYWYGFPITAPEIRENGFRKIKEIWDPILDEFEKYGIRFALEVQAGEIAFDYYTTKELLETFEYRPAMGINIDPSHLLWQGVDPALFIRDFADRIYHVHIKDAAVRMDGRRSILGSMFSFGDARRGWNFRSPGRGDVDFEEMIRALNEVGYEGPLSVEWEDNMDRVAGAKEACDFVRGLDFEPSSVDFTASMRAE